MGYYNNAPGIGNVGSYQASGHPYLTGSGLKKLQQVRISFPYVTKSITVMNTGSTGGVVRVHFAATGAAGTDQGSQVLPGLHYWELDSKEDAMTMNIKCKDIWLSNGSSHDTGFRLFAECTRIDRGQMWTLTGSGITSGGKYDSNGDKNHIGVQPAGKGDDPWHD